MWRVRRSAPLVVWRYVLVALAAMSVLSLQQPLAAKPAGSEASPVLHVDSVDAAQAPRRVSLGLHKAMIVELPVDNHDVIVSHPETIDASVHSPRRIVLFAKNVGTANAFFLGRDGRKLLILDIVVHRDLSELSDLLKKVLPGSRIKLAASGSGVVLTGNVAQPADASRAEEIAKQFLKDGGTVANLIAANQREQVLLKVTVAEIQRDAIRRLGVNLPEVVTKAGAFTFAKVMQNGFPVTAATAVASSFTGAGKVPEVAAGTALQLTHSWKGGSASAILETFERAGLSRTLAEPTLTAVSGETAKFLAGGEYPIPVKDSNGQTSVTYKEFGVGVSFTPVVLSEGRISLKIESEVSELTNVGAVVLDSTSIPALKKRQANSTVELPSGGSIALAGLISDDVRQNIDGFPGLKDVPVLGTLFRSRDFIQQRVGAGGACHALHREAGRPRRHEPPRRGLRAGLRSQGPVPRIAQPHLLQRRRTSG